MFHDIPEPIAQRMRELEEMDRADRTDGTEHHRRLRQVPPETGRFLALMAACSPPGAWVEIGTSAGYSALWIALAGRELGRKLKTFEIMPEKVALARETFRRAGISASVELITGDGLEGLTACSSISFCFLDADKPRAVAYLELIRERLVPGGILVVDNAISHAEKLLEFRSMVAEDRLLDGQVIPIGKGVLLCRRAISAEQD